MLPHVPSVWSLTCFAVRWLWGKIRLSKDLPDWPGFWAEPPSRILPAMSEVTLEESQVRQKYWVAVLLLGPPVMCILCQAVRMIAFAVRLMVAKAISAMSSQPSPEYVQMSTQDPDADEKDDHEQSNRHSQREANTAKDDGADGYMSSEFCAAIRLWVALALYHSGCASLVLVALRNDWLSLGSGLAWELWTLWQQVCLWTLFCQNLMRCCSADGPAPTVKTAKTVLMFTMPIVSEVFDTVKDWVVAGQCLLAPATVGGFFWGAAFAAADFCLSRLLNKWFMRHRCMWLPVWPPLLLVQVVVPAASAAVFVPLLLFVSAPIVAIGVVYGLLAWKGEKLSPIYYVFILSATFSGVFLAVDAVVPILRPFWANSFHSSYHVLWAGLDIWADGSCLCVASIYVIIFAYIVASWYKTEAAADLRNTYMGILALPKAAFRSGAATYLEMFEVTMSNFAVEFLSHARLFIAWAEDWPQGFVGVFVGLKTGSDFAWVSAIISLCKGLLIPVGQSLIFNSKSRQVRKHLALLVCSDEGLLRCAQEVPGTSRQKFEDLQRQLFPTLHGIAEEVLLALNVLRGRDLYIEIWRERDRWIKETLVGQKATIRKAAKKSGQSLNFNLLVADPGDSVRDAICGAYLQLRLPGNLTQLSRALSSLDSDEAGDEVPRRLREVRQDGYPASVCRLAGFSCTACLKAGYEVAECLQAGFPADGWQEAGYSLERCREAGFTARGYIQVGFKRDVLRDLGMSVSTCKEAGCTASECRAAGFTAAECEEAGYDVRKLRRAGYTFDELQTVFVGVRIPDSDSDDDYLRPRY
ncbi:unnamed protein product [Symbiodinium sp. CCMP2592]|nr:unnamed protein product [Symbiodinium sp. CCMP2592]